MESRWLIVLCSSLLAGAYAVSDEYVQTLADLVSTLDRDLRQLKKTIPQIEENVIMRVDMSQHDLRAEILNNMVSRRMGRDLQLRQNQMKRQHQGMFREIIKLKKQLSVCLTKNEIKRFTTRIENLEKMTNSNDIYGAVNNLQEQKGNNSTLEANYMALRTNALEATEAKLETAKSLLQTQQLDYVSAIEKLKTDFEMKHNDTANNIVQLDEGFRNMKTELQATKDDLKANLQDFSSLNTSVNDEIQTLATDLETKTTLQTLNTRLQEQQQKCSSSINALRSDLSSHVLFKAYLTSNIIVNKGATIKFDMVVSNIGNGYNPYSGVFTATVSGYYAFTVILGGVKGGYANFSIKKQNNIEAYLIFFSADWAIETMSTTAHVRKGDHVCVMMAMHNGKTILGGNWALSQFSGYLLHAD